MSMTESIQNSGLHLSIAGGVMVEKSEEGVVGAKSRSYEDKDGNAKVKFELHHKNLTGVITDIAFVKTDFGEQANITLESSDDKVVLHMSTDSNYFSDLAKKLPNVAINDLVTVNPYDFVDDKGKKRRGITIIQDGVKLSSFYYDPKTKKNVGDLPTPAKNGEGFDSDDWKVYFVSVKKFLKAQVEAMDFGVNVITDTPLETQDGEEIFG